MDMHQVAAHRRHQKKRAFGFIPNLGGQDDPSNNNDSGQAPAANNVQSTSSDTVAATSSAVATSTTAALLTTTTSSSLASVQSTTSSSSTTTSAAASTTSSTTVTTSSKISTVVVPPTPVVNQLPTIVDNPITRSVVTHTITTQTLASSAPSPTATSDSSGPPIGALVGAIGGGLLGLIALAALAGYFFRRAFRTKDEFDRTDFVRNSVAIGDGWDEKPPMGTHNAIALARANNGFPDEPSATPRPPTMIERRGQAQAPYQIGEVMNPAAGYYGQDQYYNYGNNGHYGHEQYAGYPDQQYATGDQAYTAAGGYGYIPPNEYQQSQLTRKPSAPRRSARGLSGEQQQEHDDGDPPAQGDHPTVPQYDARHLSVTPFQQQQYNEINKALNGGARPISATPAGGRELLTAYSTLNQPQQPAHGQQQDHLAVPNPQHEAANNRKSVYDDEDAYGGM